MSEIIYAFISEKLKEIYYESLDVIVRNIDLLSDDELYSVPLEIMTSNDFDNKRKA